MELTEYTIYKYDGREYIRFESIERNIFGIKKSVMRFVPTKTMIDENGKRIKKWKISMFPKEVNRFNKYRLVAGGLNFREDFEDRYPNIQMYLNDLNSGAFIY